MSTDKKERALGHRSLGNFRLQWLHDSGELNASSNCVNLLINHAAAFSDKMINCQYTVVYKVSFELQLLKA